MNNLVTLLLSLALSSCSMAPKYTTPKSPVELEKVNQEKVQAKISDWKSFFPNSDVQRLINLGLENNRDLKIANINIKIAQSTYQISKYNLFPQINARASMSKSKLPTAVSAFMPERRYDAGFMLTSFELDFFGKLNSLRKAARQEVLASSYGSEVMKISLIAQIASSYAKFLIDKDILENSNMILDASEEKYQIAQAMYYNRIFDKSDLLLAKELLNQSKAILEQDQLTLAESKNTLMELSGVFKEDQFLPKDNSTTDIIISKDIFNFTPSDVLLSRPDISAAESQLKAMNANIGAARAAFFPSISLTGNIGYASEGLSNLFAASNWTYTPQINLPLFPLGGTLSNLKIANLRKEVAIINYEKAIQSAFKEVLDLLAAKKMIDNQLDLAQENLKLQKEIYDLTKKKFVIGIISKDQLLNDRINYFATKTKLLELQKLQIINQINLFKAFGAA